ncbi:MAG: gamma-glutamyltransferase [Helicobacter sp.]|nr:gamma-glutamyltransferase [Helicobacter sp.]
MKVLLICTILFTNIMFAAFPAPKKSKNGMVTSSNAIATKIGTEVLENGGNAFDAAVAVGYALAVVHPSAGNLGGGGFAVIRTKDGQSYALDFRESAPSKATRDMYLDGNKQPIKDLSIIGYLAAGVPGSVAGLNALNERFGSKSLHELIDSSIKLAQNGFPITPRQEQTMLSAKDDFAKFESSRKYFLKPDGTTYKEGEMLVQQDLAKTLRAIQKDGTKAFYEGEIADLIAKDMQKNGGIITKQDLKNYQVKWREPISGTYRGYNIISMPPPSSGGVHILEILNIMENAPIKDLGVNSSKSIHIMAEAMRQAYVDRTHYLGDPDFIRVPTSKLIDKNYAKKIYENIKDKVIPSSKIKTGGLEIYESPQTTHYSIVDKEGNAIAITYTLNGSYGSGAAVNGAGFLLNNEMDDFSIKPGVPNLYGLIGSSANEIAPNKRPLSSMSPTIVTKDNELFMVVGSPGGARIITTVLQVISNVIDHGMNLQEAVLFPRFHMQYLPDEIRYEKFGLSNDTIEALQNMGYIMAQKAPMGDVNAILVERKNDGVIFYGAEDTRREF